MTEQQKKIIKEAIEKATEAWTALGAVAETLEAARECSEPKGNEIALSLIMTEDAFRTVQHNVELRIAYLERLAKE